MATMKKAAKKSAAKVIPMPADKSAVTLKFGVDTNDLKDLLGAADRFQKSAEAMQDAAKVISAAKDPGEKQLHRKVLVYVYDAIGTRIVSASYDLAKTDELTVTVDEERGLAAAVTSAER